MYITFDYVAFGHYEQLDIAYIGRTKMDLMFS